MSKNHPNDNIYSILGKLEALKPTAQEKHDATVKAIYESVDARGSMLEGVSAIEEKLQKEFVAEKAVSQAQQKFMGMVHATQKGEKAPSKEVAKVAKSMGKKDAKDFASTKHKGLPQHVEEEMCNECGMTIEGCECDHEEMAESSYVHKGTYGNSYTGDDEADTDTKPKGKGRPKKDDGEKSSANLPWGGKPPKDTYKHEKGSWGMKDHKKFGESVTESINFKKLMDDTHMSVDEMISCLQNDIRNFKATGEMSDTLRDFMELHRHSRKQADEAIVKPTPTDIKLSTPAVTRKAAAGPDTTDWMITHGDLAQKEREMPTTPAGLAQRKQDLGMAETDALNELAKLAGIADEGNAFSGALAKAKAQHQDKFNVDGEEYEVTEADAPVDEPVEEPVNGPKKKYFSLKNSTLNPGEGEFGEKTMNPDRPTFKNGDNALSRPPVRESSLELEAKLQAEYDSIKLKK
jgi:Protein of unknwon function (DUF3008)